jgi:hypothetical protein
MATGRIQEPSKHSRSAMIPFAALALVITGGARPGLAEQAGQPAFPSASEASQKLFEAVQSNNEQTIAGILGGPTDLTSSHDPGQDEADRKVFVRKYQEMHRLARQADGSLVFSISVRRTGRFPYHWWRKAAPGVSSRMPGQKEILLRRIGENELIAIACCRRVRTRARRRADLL